DGIRDRNVTGVQTCALPIFMLWYFVEQDIPNNGLKDVMFGGMKSFKVSAQNVMLKLWMQKIHSLSCIPPAQQVNLKVYCTQQERSEERRVGKEDSSRCWADE